MDRRPIKSAGGGNQEASVPAGPADRSKTPKKQRRSADLARGEVNEVQRAWLLAAVVKVSAERGPGALTVARVSDRAGVSRRTFYELFKDCEECLLVAMEQAVARVSIRVVSAFEGEEGWRVQIRSALGALLAFFDAEPATARLCVVDTLAAGREILKHRMLVLAPVIKTVDQGRELSRQGFEPPALAAEGVVGAALHVIHTRLVEQSREPLRGLLNPLMSMIVWPYLGEEAAEVELRMPVLSVDSDLMALPEAPHIETFQGLKLRLTYRTLRVLRAVEASPGSSNREIADAADIRDQGQISKLLGRLRGLELLRNTVASTTAGGSNVWWLTDKGERLMRSIGTLGTVPHEPE